MMTEHEQGQSPVWTDEQIARRASSLVWRANGSTKTAMEMGMGSACDAWQADHDQLVTANEQMAGQIGDLATERDGLVAKLDAANQRIDSIYNDGLEDFTETDLERYSQLSPPEMYRAMKATQQRIAELEGQLADVLRVAIARGEELGFADADNEWCEWHKQLTGSDYDESEADDNE